MEMYSDKVTIPPVPNPTRSPRMNSSPFSSSPPTRSSSPPGQSPAPSHNSSSKQRPSHPLPTPPAVVLSPCAACKILRRRCVENCVLAPYFPPTEPYKFMIAHRVFGASNIIKFLQELPECQRADAVSSMVYEANARIRDPVYGCTGAICHLQKQVTELQGQLAKAEAELVTIQSQHRNLLSLICMQMTNHHHDDDHHHHDHHEPINILHQYQPQQQFPDSSCNLQLDDYTLGSITWDHEPLWT